MLRLRLTLLVCLFAFAVQPAADAPAATRMQANDMGTRIAKYARRFVGTPYRYGGMSPRGGFDCSGLVAYVYRHFGFRLPHYTYAQYSLGRHVPGRRLEPGDLVFFFGRGHVGLYVGRGLFIHAPHSGARVRIDRLRAEGSFAGARRIVRRAAAPAGRAVRSSGRARRR